jgi:hypothetical protein
MMEQAAAVDSKALPDELNNQLGADDDLGLWVATLRSAAEDAAALHVAGDRSKLYAIVGTCSHWLRPHQTRWTAAGGFAWPEGYGDGHGRGGLPHLDWAVTLQFDRAGLRWDTPTQAPAQRFQSVRLSIPARTARHLQAAVHAVWSPGTLDAKYKWTVFYGLRKLEQGWTLVAREQFGEGKTRSES